MSASKNKTPVVIDMSSKKRSISKTMPLCIRAAQAAACVHTKCTFKHPFHSWENIPEKSDSTIENNIDAIMRHYINYSENHIALEKESGLPHLFHIACRAHMLLGTFYRDRLGRVVEYNPQFRRSSTIKEVCEIFNKLLLGNQSNPLDIRNQINLEADQISNYLFMSMSKSGAEIINEYSAEVWEQILKYCIFAITSAEPINSMLQREDDLNLKTDIFHVDLLWYAVCGLVNALDEKFFTTHVNGLIKDSFKCAEKPVGEHISES